MDQKLGRGMDEQLLENSQDTKFYAKTAMRKAGHVGMVMLALYILEKAKKNNEDRKIANVLYVISATLFVLDEVDALIYEIKKILKRKRK